MFVDLAIADFQERTGLPKREFARAWDGAECIVSLRSVARVLEIKAMPVKYLTAMIYSIVLAGDQNAQPYKDCPITLVRVDPKALVVGQTFVERPKYKALLESFPNIFADFCVSRGIAKCTPLIVLGERSTGEPVIAHYLPPIIEEHGGMLHVLDGVHRNFLVKSVGTTIESVIVRGVHAPFPCRAQGWGSVNMVDAKPPKEERFFNLQADLFRDVKRIGIDG